MTPKTRMNPPVLAMFASLAQTHLVVMQLFLPPQIMSGALTKTVTHGIPYTSSQIVNQFAHQ